jgi:glycosyltransferase involved in cell wall biosynthesis
MDMDISIVMTYWNRKQQLTNTLKSIRSYEHDVEIIIIDDASTDGEDITNLADKNTRIIRLENKTWVNPCIAFNHGFKEATGDVIIIQNAECLHNGDIIANVKEYAKKNVYLNYSALNIDCKLTNRITNGEDINSVISPYIKNSANDYGCNMNGWYNHPEYRPVGYHFCSAILRSDLYDIGGFDERYVDGSGFDDDEFLCRIKKKGMVIKTVEYPFVIHTPPLMREM